MSEPGLRRNFGIFALLGAGYLGGGLALASLAIATLEGRAFSPPRLGILALSVALLCLARGLTEPPRTPLWRFLVWPVPLAGIAVAAWLIRRAFSP